MDRIFITRRIPRAGLDILADAGAELVIGQEDGERGIEPEALLNGVASCDVLLSLLTERIDAPLLETAPRLRGIANFAVGFNNIDIDAATALGIPVSNTPGVLTETTADLTWALLLAVARRIPEAHAYTTAGRYRIWGPELLLGADVGPGPDDEPRTLGIIGFGRIGRAVARRATGFDMRVLAYDPHARADIDASPHAVWADLDELIATGDFITLHALLTPGTHHIIGEAQLRAMKPTAYVINVARGEMIDEAALVRALRDGRIAGAALDVYEREPELAAGLAELDNVVLAPHIGSATRGTRDRMARMAATNAIAHLRAERAPNIVNPGVYDTAAYAERVRRSAT